MSVIQDNSITSNNIQPASSQSLTIKDEGGTASITVQTDGDLTLAENAYLGSGKGIYFDGQTTSANFLDDYEEGTWSPTFGGTAATDQGTYIKVGNLVFIKGDITNPNSSSTSTATISGLPFTATSPHSAWTSGYSDGGIVGGYFTGSNIKSTNAGATTNKAWVGGKRSLIMGMYSTS